MDNKFTENLQLQIFVTCKYFLESEETDPLCNIIVFRAQFMLPLSPRPGDINMSNVLNSFLSQEKGSNFGFYFGFYP